MSEFVSFMRVMVETNAAMQATVLKVLLEKQDGGANTQAMLLKVLLEKQDGSASIVPLLLKALLDRPTPNPFESVTEALRAMQAMSGARSNSKDFVQGVEFALDKLGGAKSEGDDLGAFTSMFNMLTTLKADSATKNAPAAKAAPRETSDAGGEQVQAAVEKPRKKNPEPPPAPADEYTEMPPINGSSFQSWPWQSIPAQSYGMMYDPAYRAWSSYYTVAPQQSAAQQPIPPAPNVQAPAPQKAEPTPSRSQASSVNGIGQWRRTVGVRRGARRIRKVAVSTAPSTAPEQLPVIEQQHVVENAIPEAPVVEDVVAELLPVAATEPVPVIVEELIVEQAPVIDDEPSETSAASTSMKTPLAVNITLPLDMMSGFPVGAPPADLTTSMFLALQSDCRVAGKELCENEDDDNDNLDEHTDDGDTHDSDDEEAKQDSTSTESIGGPVADLIALAAADPEFESVVPEEFRSMLRTFLGKGGGTS